MPRKKKDENIEEVVEEVVDEEVEEEIYDEEEYDDYDEDYEEEEVEDIEDIEQLDDIEEIEEEDLDNFDEDIALIDDVEDEDYNDEISDIVGGLGATRVGDEMDDSMSAQTDTISNAEFYEKLEKLADIGKEKGILESHEIEEFFKEDNIDSSLLEAAIDYLERKQIAVIREEDDEENLELDEDSAKEALDLTVAEGISTEDPVRMYLKDIGQVQLLTADEERELAIMMENGLKASEEMKELQAQLREGTAEDAENPLSEEEVESLKEQIAEKRAIVDEGNDAKQKLTRSCEGC